MGWFVRVLVGFDQFINAIAGGNPDETISSRVVRNAAAGRRPAIVLEGMIDALFAIVTGERHHCANKIGS